MTLDKMNQVFNLLAEHKKGLTPEEEASFDRHKISKVMRIIKDEINKQTNGCETCLKR
jgi:hypothetical protein